ncbi:type 3 dihydrofolate reductase [Alteromonas sp. RKMC-009]|uniref:type 3 dihydrofolate reductase n=1 Tax=Alteromonas sp. RKMC-009 TaxID=2267264 RepID=UPI001E55F672|nr:type 3 dihydrofolate reductase [Alteromonas sp. RKMC-009]MEC7691993.1 type 3 dihydrofolate reductase [Pseudomonadota bacterium]
MKIAMIAAMAHNRVIGADNDMPWHLPADLKHFKAVTLGKPVIMGRRTWESIGRPLPGRPNIIITSAAASDFPDTVTVVTNVEEALSAASEMVTEDDEVMVIGGGKVYEAFLPQATTLYLTQIALTVDGDTCFPDYDSQGDWVRSDVVENRADEHNPYDYTFFTLTRK